MTREALKKLNEKQMNYCKTLSVLIDRAKIKGLKEENERNRGKLRGFLECMEQMELLSGYEVKALLNTLVGMLPEMISIIGQIIPTIIDRYEICSRRRIRHGAGSNTYPDRRGSGSRRGGKRQNSPYTFQSGKSGLQGNCAGTHRHRGRNDNRRHCSTERSIKAV